MSSSTSSNKRQKTSGPFSPTSTARLQKAANKTMEVFRNEAEEKAIGLLETFLPKKVVELGLAITNKPEFNLKGTSHFDPGQMPPKSKSKKSSITNKSTNNKDKLSDSDDEDEEGDGADRIVPSNQAVQKCIDFLKIESHEGVSIQSDAGAM
jgi:hypothetical protein